MVLKLEKILEDSRGSIHVLNGDELQHHDEFTILKTKMGCARGGCIHKIHDENCIVLEGSIEYYMNNTIRELSKGDMICVPKGISHYFISLTDSIVLEWGASIEEKGCKDIKMRKIVDRINRKING